MVGEHVEFNDAEQTDRDERCAEMLEDASDWNGSFQHEQKWFPHLRQILIQRPPGQMSQDGVD